MRAPIMSLAWVLPMLVAVACGEDEDDQQQFGEVCELRAWPPP